MIPGRKLFFFAVRDTFRTVFSYGIWFGVVFAAYNNDIRWAAWLLGTPLAIILTINVIQFVGITVAQAIVMPRNLFVSMRERDWIAMRDETFVTGAYILNTVKNIFFITYIVWYLFIVFSRIHKEGS